MRMNIIRRAILYFCLIVFLFLLSSYESQARDEPLILGIEETAFSVPLFPGTELIGPYNSDRTIAPPFTTLIFVLKNKNGNPVDAAGVIAFYRDAFFKKGWKENVEIQADSKESQLSLQYSLYNADTGQNLTGQLRLYVAPKDGLIILYLRQWRNPSVGKSITNLFDRLARESVEIEKEARLEFVASGKLCRWENFFEDENFLDGIYYNWIAEESPSDITEAVVAAYSDSQAAQKAKKNFISKDRFVESKGNILVMVQSKTRKTSESLRQTEESILNNILRLLK